MNNFIKRIGIERITPLVLIVCMFLFLVIFNQNRKSVLVLQSYYTDYSWVQDVNNGINKVLSKQDLYRVQFHYMDTKRHPGQDYLIRAGKTARQIIQKTKPDVIIAVDDDAQQYVARHFVNEPGISIVYAGVNGQPEDYGYDKATNVTGILERIPLEGLRDTLKVLMGGKKYDKIRIFHLSDQSKTVQLDDKYMCSFKDWGCIDVKPSHLVPNFEEWKNVVINAEGNVDFIIVSNYRKIQRSEADNSLVSSNEIMDWTVKNSKVPIIGVNGFVVTDGARLAIATSPYEQGEVAAKTAVDILSGKKASDIPHTKTEQFIVCIRKNLKDDEPDLYKSLQLPAIYSSFSKVINKFIEE